MTDIVMTVDRDRFRLEVWALRPGQNHYFRMSKYSIGIGKRGLATPRGVYSVVSKNKTPDWKVPDSEWAIARGLKPGTIYKYNNETNPFAGGFISLSGGEGIGIHGTKFDPEVGTRSSAGCVRMIVSDFKELYPRATPGTPVVIL